MTAHVESAIERYFDGVRITPGDRDALFGHMDRCHDCRSYFDELALTHRALAGKTGDVPATELALIGQAVAMGATTEPVRERRWLTGLASAIAAASAVLLAAVFIGPKQEAFTAKGGAVLAASPTVEVLCFDEQAEVVAHLKQSGACPAPGFIKLVFASPKTVETLAVAVLSGEKLLSLENLQSPSPRGVLPGHVQLARGETLRIVISDDELDRTEALTQLATMTVEGVR
jgi:hypothetical protein